MMYGINYNGLRKLSSYDSILERIQAGAETGIPKIDRRAKNFRNSFQVSDLLDGNDSFSDMEGLQKRRMALIDIEHRMTEFATDNGLSRHLLRPAVSEAIRTHRPGPEIVVMAGDGDARTEFADPEYETEEREKENEKILRERHRIYREGFIGAVAAETDANLLMTETKSIVTDFVRDINLGFNPRLNLDEEDMELIEEDKAEILRQKKAVTVIQKNARRRETLKAEAKIRKEKAKEKGAEKFFYKLENASENRARSLIKSLKENAEIKKEQEQAAQVIQKTTRTIKTKINTREEKTNARNEKIKIKEEKRKIVKKDVKKYVENIIESSNEENIAKELRKLVEKAKTINRIKSDERMAKMKEDDPPQGQPASSSASGSRAREPSRRERLEAVRSKSRAPEPQPPEEPPAPRARSREPAPRKETKKTFMEQQKGGPVDALASGLNNTLFETLKRNIRANETTYEDYRRLDKKQQNEYITSTRWQEMKNSEQNKILHYNKITKPDGSRFSKDDARDVFQQLKNKINE